MFSFTCSSLTEHYDGIAAAWTFFNDCREEYLQAIRRVHPDLRRPGHRSEFRGRAVMVERLRSGIWTRS
jgi:hypothetical protein